MWLVTIGNDNTKRSSSTPVLLPYTYSWPTWSPMRLCSRACVILFCVWIFWDTPHQTTERKLPLVISSILPIIISLTNYFAVLLCSFSTLNELQPQTSFARWKTLFYGNGWSVIVVKTKEGSFIIILWIPVVDIISTSPYVTGNLLTSICFNTYNLGAQFNSLPLIMSNISIYPFGVTGTGWLQTKYILYVHIGYILICIFQKFYFSLSNLI